MENINRKIQQLVWFIAQVESGKTCLLLSQNFVIMDRKSWEELKEKSSKKQIIILDESSEITDEDWEILYKRIKTNEN